MLFCVAAATVTATGAACSVKGPNTTAPEDKLLYDLGNALGANDKATGVTLMDLEVRQRFELWDRTLKPLKKQEDQLAALTPVAPSLGDAAALITVGEEAWSELRAAQNIAVDELAAGKCVSGPPAKEDIGRGIMPKEDEKKMAPEVGAFVFQLRTMVNWTPAFRVTCPKSQSSFWVQMAQRKKGDSGQEQPLRLVRVMR